MGLFDRQGKSLKFLERRPASFLDWLLVKRYSIRDRPRSNPIVNNPELRSNRAKQTMTDTRRIINLSIGSFFPVDLRAVMWVKGYLWSQSASRFGFLSFSIILTAQNICPDCDRLAICRGGPKTKKKGEGALKKVGRDERDSWREPRPQWSRTAEWGAINGSLGHRS